MKAKSLAPLALLAGAHSLHAATMISLAATGWNQDMIIGATESTPTGSTATMDQGTTNGAATWYGVGFNTSAPTTGLPSGLTASATTPADLSFQLQSFTAPNAILNNGTLTLATPAPMLRLALIGSTGNGIADLTITVNYAGGITQVFNSLGNDSINFDWFGGTPIAYTANGRVDNSNGNFDVIDSGNPRLYQSVFTLNNNLANVNSVTIANNGGGNSAILAISGEAVPEPSAVLLGALGAISLLRRKR